MRIFSEETAGVFIDFQEKLVPAIYRQEQIIEKAVIFAQGLQELEIPFAVTQQYTKGLGETVSGLKDTISEFRFIEKTSFSCWGCEEYVKWLKESGKKNVLVCGIEAHICVLQTVIDLIAEGFNVFVVADCIGSRALYDKEIALERLQMEGAFLTTCETALFELTGGAKSPHFKAISKLVK